MDESFLLTDYGPARARFRALAQAAGATLETHVDETAQGPAGEDLALDIAWTGPEEAAHVVLCTSGMHGLEAPVGSAIQAAWLAGGGPARLKPGTAVCLVHALNPWGFAHAARCTAANVDLNRNWLDFGGTLPRNPEYRHIRDLIRLPDFSPASLTRLAADYARLKDDLGPARLAIAVNHGQYEDPEGLQYGGLAPEFGSRVVMARVIPRLRRARHVGLLDWHTGVGAYGETAYLVSGGIEGAGGARAMRAWGEAAVRGWKRSATETEIEADQARLGPPAKKNGQLYQELPGWLPDAAVTGGIIEFGTEKPGSFERLMLGVLYELWLRFRDRGDRHAPRHADHLATMREAFVPADLAWRRMVVREGPRLLEALIAGSGPL